jgi:hypothetical protein
MRQLRMAIIGVAALMLMTWLVYAPAQARLALTATPSASPTSEPGSRENPLTNPCTNQPFTTIMTNSAVEEASVSSIPETSSWAINFVLATNEEAKAFSEFTATHIGERVAIAFDGKIYNVPTLQSKLTTGALITGQFTKDEAISLARLMITKPLVAPIALDSVDTQDGNLVLTVSTSTDLDENTFHALVAALKKRFESLKFEGNVREQLETHQVTFTFSPPTAEDSQFATEYLTRAGLLEFVDFSKVHSCTQTMPEVGQYIVTDYQQKLYRN